MDIGVLELSCARKGVGLMIQWALRWIAFGLLTMVFVQAPEANAFTRTLNFCNKTNVNVDVAYGYEPAGSTNTQTKGWRFVQACQCVTLFNEDVRATEMYVYVTKSKAPITEAFMDGAAPLCVRSNKFQVGPSNKSEQRCNDSGGQWVKFLQVIAEKATHTLNFGSGGNCRG